MLTRRVIAQVNVDTVPERSGMQPDTLYVSRKFDLAIHLCACGCGHETVTPLGADGWTLTETPTGPTLRPSIGNQQMPCRSHYYVTAGEFEPC